MTFIAMRKSFSPRIVSPLGHHYPALKPGLLPKGQSPWGLKQTWEPHPKKPSAGSLSHCDPEYAPPPPMPGSHALTWSL